jgi:hypothetical protein
MPTARMKTRNEWDRIVDVSSPSAPTEHFNALSDEDKKQVLSNGLGANLLHSGLAFAIPLWWLSEDQTANFTLRNGSAFLADHGQGIFAVTAAHVFSEYQEAKRTAREVVCQLGHALFNPETQLISCRDDLDIATFRVSASEAKQIDKPIVMLADPPHWEPLNPAAGNFAFLAGFPAQTRGMTASGHFVTAPYFAMPPITSVTDRQIACRFDREKMIDLGGSGLPPPGYDIGGISGGPLLMPTLVRDGVEGVVWRLGGVITEAARGEIFDQIVTVRAHYIQPDGRIG